jgi:hypothetical protein
MVIIILEIRMQCITSRLQENRILPTSTAAVCHLTEMLAIYNIEKA